MSSEPTLRPINLISLTAGPDQWTTTAFAASIVARQLRTLRELEEFVRAGDDAEALHDMRVAVRRLRSVLGSFGDVLPPGATAGRSELAWLGTELGRVRDIDVLLAPLRRMAREEPHAPLGPVVERLEARRREGHSGLAGVLASERYKSIGGALAELVVGSARPTPRGAAPIRETAPDMLLAARNRVRKAGKGIGKNSTLEELHKLRIRSKRLRYLSEFTEPLYGRPAKDFARRLTALQDVLGAQRDAALARVRVRELAAESGITTEEAFVLGRCAGEFARRERSARRKVSDAYASTRGARWRRLRDSFETGVLR